MIKQFGRIFGFNGPICARAPNLQPKNELSLRGHHDWPVKPDNPEAIT
jgi:hypothetical protein